MSTFTFIMSCIVFISSSFFPVLQREDVAGPAPRSLTDRLTNYLKLQYASLSQGEHIRIIEVDHEEDENDDANDQDSLLGNLEQVDDVNDISVDDDDLLDTIDEDEMDEVDGVDDMMEDELIDEDIGNDIDSEDFESIDDADEQPPTIATQAIGSNIQNIGVERLGINVNQGFINANNIQQAEIPNAQMRPLDTSYIQARPEGIQSMQFNPIGVPNAQQNQVQMPNIQQQQQQQPIVNVNDLHPDAYVQHAPVDNYIPQQAVVAQDGPVVRGESICCTDITHILLSV